MKHIMRPIGYPLDCPLDLQTRIRRTRHTCPCARCRTARVQRTQRAKDDGGRPASHLTAMDLLAIPGINDLLDALANVLVDALENES